MVWNGALGSLQAVDVHPRDPYPFRNGLLAQTRAIAGPAESAAESWDADSHVIPRLPTLSVQIVANPGFFPHIHVGK